MSDTFQDRQKTAAEAKARLLEKLAARPGPDDPVMIAKAAERKAAAEARQAAAEARKAAKIARQEAEAAAAQAAA
ncbi:DUF6481 family protein, partial [Ancylobacter dichloromethanicus]